MYTFKTISSLSLSEFKDRGSRFLGFCIPVNTLDHVKIELKKLKELHIHNFPHLVIILNNYYFQNF